MFTDAGVFAGDRFMSDASGFIASGANELEFGNVDRQFFGDDAALGEFEAGFGVTFNLIDALDDDFTHSGDSGEDNTVFALIFTGANDNGIAFFKV